MPDEENSTNVDTWVASFAGQSLLAGETPRGYRWEVANATTGQIVASGESSSREDAMVSAAEAAGADWGNAKWRQPGETNPG